MIKDLVRPELVFGDIDARTRDDALTVLARSIAQRNAAVDGAQLLETLRQREVQATTAFGDGVAIPHARLRGLERMIVAFARSTTGIDWGAPDKRPVHLILMLAGPAEKPEVYLRALAAASRLLRDAQCRARLLTAPTSDELLRILREDGGKGGGAAAA